MRSTATPHRHVYPLVTGHFRERAGYQVFRPHGVDDWLLIWTVSGSGTVASTGSPLHTWPGTVVLYRPRTLQRYLTTPGPSARWELLWTHFYPRPHWIPWLDWPLHSPGLHVLHTPAGPARRRGLEKIGSVHRAASGPGPWNREKAMNSLEDFLLFTAELSGQLARSGPSDPRILRAMQTVCADLAAPHSVASLARTAGLSPSRFAHLFKKETGLTPQRYIEQQRIERAAQLLLRTPLPVAEIARQVGFDCPFYFSTRFSHHTGRSPRNHRVLNGA